MALLLTSSDHHIHITARDVLARHIILVQIPHVKEGECRKKY